MSYTDQHKGAKNPFGNNQHSDKNMAQNAILKLQETANKLIA